MLLEPPTGSEMMKGPDVLSIRAADVLQMPPLLRSPENKQMSHLCRVCGQRAAGFHFGVFTCEGCKSFFGRTYNNLSAVYGCKNGGNCVINMETRTSCKPCRLKKCLMVGMSKNGSRYGRRSNWFKIHCMLEEQSNQPRSQIENEFSQQFNKSDIFKSNLDEICSSSNFPLPFHPANFKDQGNIPHVDNELRSVQMKMMMKPPASQDTNLSPVTNTLNFMNQMNHPMFGHHLGFSPLYISQILGKPIAHTNTPDSHTSLSASPSSSSAGPLTPPLEVDDIHPVSTMSPPAIRPLLPLQLQEELMQNLHLQRLFWNRKRSSDSFHEESFHDIAIPETHNTNQSAEQDSPIDLSVKRPRYTATPETAIPDSPPSTPIQIPLSIIDTPIDLSIRT
ncbi:unnamed protein product [Meganyctiphanes norvegica]|uniref:Nuclear receptor domain-containing protein n=1 Tax=Meganyctiphanes norvegica TaxID=48144 RepID=A0AAV2Q367_MEGNR